MIAIIVYTHRYISVCVHAGCLALTDMTLVAHFFPHRRCFNDAIHFFMRLQKLCFSCFCQYFQLYIRDVAAIQKLAWLVFVYFSPLWISDIAINHYNPKLKNITLYTKERKKCMQRQYLNKPFIPITSDTNTFNNALTLANKWSGV